MSDTPAGDMLVATQTFWTELDGKPVKVQQGVTRVREGHPLVVGREHYFKAADTQYEVEDATARPQPAAPPRKVEGDPEQPKDDQGDGDGDDSTQPKDDEGDKQAATKKAAAAPKQQGTKGRGR